MPCKYTKRRSRCAGRRRSGVPGGPARLPAPTRSARVFGLARRAAYGVATHSHPRARVRLCRRPVRTSV